MRLIAPPAHAPRQKSPAEIPAGSPADLPASPADLLALAIADTTIN